MTAEYVPKTSFDDAMNALSNSVPKEEYLVSQTKLQEVETKFANYVSFEELTSAKAKISELESKLAESVPKAFYEELNARFSQANSAPVVEVPALSVEPAVETTISDQPIVEEIVIVESPVVSAQSEVAPERANVPELEQVTDLIVEQVTSIPEPVVEIATELTLTAEPSPVQMTLEEVHAVPVESSVNVPDIAPASIATETPAVETVALEDAVPAEVQTIEKNEPQPAQVEIAAPAVESPIEVATTVEAPTINVETPQPADVVSAVHDIEVAVPDPIAEAASAC